MNTITNPQYKDYTKISRYSAFPYYYNVEDNKYFYGITASLKKDVPYVTHTVVLGDTLDSLSLYYYNNPTYYWIICDFNDILDPYTELKVGQKLKIPTFSAVEYNI